MDINMLQKGSFRYESNHQELKDKHKAKSDADQKFLNLSTDYQTGVESKSESEMFKFLFWLEPDKPYNYPHMSNNMMLFKLSDLPILQPVGKEKLISGILQNNPCLPSLAASRIYSVEEVEWDALCAVQQQEMPDMVRNTVREQNNIPNIISNLTQKILKRFYGFRKQVLCETESRIKPQQVPEITDIIIRGTNSIPEIKSNEKEKDNDLQKETECESKDKITLQNIQDVIANIMQEPNSSQNIKSNSKLLFLKGVCDARNDTTEELQSKIVCQEVPDIIQIIKRETIDTQEVKLNLSEIICSTFSEINSEIKWESESKILLQNVADITENIAQNPKNIDKINSSIQLNSLNGFHDLRNGKVYKSKSNTIFQTFPKISEILVQETKEKQKTKSNVTHNSFEDFEDSLKDSGFGNRVEWEPKSRIVSQDVLDVVENILQKLNDMLKASLYPYQRFSKDQYICTESEGKTQYKVTTENMLNITKTSVQEPMMKEVKWNTTQKTMKDICDLNKKHDCTSGANITSEEEEGLIQNMQELDVIQEDKLNITHRLTEESCNFGNGTEHEFESNVMPLQVPHITENMQELEDIQKAILNITHAFLRDLRNLTNGEEYESVSQLTPQELSNIIGNILKKPRDFQKVKVYIIQKLMEALFNFIEGAEYDSKSKIIHQEALDTTKIMIAEINNKQEKKSMISRKLLGAFYDPKEEINCESISKLTPRQAYSIVQNIQEWKNSNPTKSDITTNFIKVLFDSQNGPGWDLESKVTSQEIPGIIDNIMQNPNDVQKTVSDIIQIIFEDLSAFTSMEKCESESYATYQKLNEKIKNIVKESNYIQKAKMKFLESFCNLINGAERESEFKINLQKLLSITKSVMEESNCMQQTKPTATQKLLENTSNLLNGTEFESNPKVVQVSDINENMKKTNDAQKTKPNMTQKFLKGFCDLKNESGWEFECKIFELLCWYESNKSVIDSRLSRKIVLFKIPDLCFLYQIDNRILVSKVLQSIHCLPRTAVPHLVSFLTLNCYDRNLPLEIQKTGKASFNFIAYFLHHSNMKKLLFGGKRLTELIEMTNPVLYAKIFLFSSTKCVLTLLQYGLTFEVDGKYVRIHPIFPYITGLFIESAEDMDDLQINLMSYPERLRKLLENFKIILRSTHNPHNIIFHMLNYAKEQSVEEYKLLDSIFSNILPEVYFKIPCAPKLQHSCRYVIRKQLLKLWRLPYGIWQLHLKSDLINYLHLVTKGL